MTQLDRALAKGICFAIVRWDDTLYIECRLRGQNNVGNDVHLFTQSGPHDIDPTVQLSVAARSALRRLAELQQELRGWPGVVSLRESRRYGGE